MTESTSTNEALGLSLAQVLVAEHRGGEARPLLEDAVGVLDRAGAGELAHQVGARHIAGTALARYGSSANSASCGRG
jgi:hypothetical protein